MNHNKYIDTLLENNEKMPTLDLPATIQDNDDVNQTTLYFLFAPMGYKLGGKYSITANLVYSFADKKSRNNWDDLWNGKGKGKSVNLIRALYISDIKNKSRDGSLSFTDHMTKKNIFTISKKDTDRLLKWAEESKVDWTGKQSTFL